MTHVTIETAGRRFYLRGNTYPHKDALRSAGCKWDGEAKAWWTGKYETAEKVVATICGAVAAASTTESVPAASGSDRGTPRGEKLEDSTPILGKASYKGRSYYIVWEGTTKRGPAAKLAFTDGSSTFWVSQGEFQVEKRYEARERFRGYGRGGVRAEPMTFGRLQAFKERAKLARAQGNDDGIPNGARYECEECGDRVTRGEGTCWETGAAH